MIQEKVENIPRVTNLGFLLYQILNAQQSLSDLS